MITYYLGKEEIDGYAIDLANRLTKDQFPRVWVALGQSGNAMADCLGPLVPEDIKDQVQVVCCTWNRTQQRIVYADPLDTKIISNERVLVIDSAIHSGTSMLAVCESVAEMGAINIISYSLVLKKSSQFIPTFFGVLIQDEDRAYFMLSEIPNNRLMKDKPPFGYIRQLRDSDIHIAMARSGNGSVDNTSGDLLYRKKAEGFIVYLYVSESAICGYVCLRMEGDRMFIDTLLADSGHQGRGVGTALLRWSETLARSSCCKAIELWSIHDRIKYYQLLGFESAEQGSIQYDDKTSFHHMKRVLLYNTREHALNQR